MISAKKFFVLLNLLLLAGVVYYGVQIFYKIAGSKIAPAQLTQMINKPGRLNQGAVPPRYRTYKPIVTRDLFNTGTKAGRKEASINVEALQPTRLNLKLWGTVAAENGQAAYAVIEDLKTRKQSLYRTGDPVTNATVKHILREKVILNVNGKDEILEMAQAPVVETPVRNRRGNTASRRKIVLKRAMIENATRDIGSLMQQVRITPHSEKGQPAGLRVTGIKPGSVFRKAGLRNGDILTAAGGKRISALEDMVATYESLKTADSIDIQIKRRNRLQTITYSIQ